MEHLDSKNEENSVFGPVGPLGSHFARVELAFQLGWMERSTYDALTLFRKIRNEFAHKAFKISYSDEPVQKYFAQLQKLLAPNIEKLETIVDADKYLKFNELSEKRRKLLLMAMLANLAFRELFFFPIAKEHHVDPNDLWKFASMPERAKEFTRKCVSAVLLLMLK
ncbi:MAG: hypothetical protein KGO53_09325 [Alphaproteobacteria bacterium]|nr:hypothetical protein [Alphaproteobacteria bacterium]